MNILKAVAFLALIGTGACTVSASNYSGASGGPSRFIASNNMIVFGDPAVPGRFEVQQRAGRGNSDYWCAAGEFVMQGMAADGSTRIYLETPYGSGHLSSSGKTAGFTVRPDAQLSSIAAGQSNGLSMRINRVGENWGAQHARQQCPSVFFNPFNS